MITLLTFFAVNRFSSSIIFYLYLHAVFQHAQNIAQHSFEINSLFNACCAHKFREIFKSMGPN